MNARVRDRIALASVIAMGLGMSTGYPLGMIVAAGMPVACLARGTRSAAFRNALAYYIAALWPMVAGLYPYIGRTATFLAPIALWAFAAMLLSLPWMIAATSHCRAYLWRAPLAVLATVVPPLGIIGLASPLTAAGYLFPGSAWAGIALVALTPGIFLAARALPFRQCCVVWCFVIGFCIGCSLGGWYFGSNDAQPPRGWVAVNTNFGDLSQPFHDFIAARFIQQKAAESPHGCLSFRKRRFPAGPKRPKCSGAVPRPGGPCK